MKLRGAPAGPALDALPVQEVLGDVLEGLRIAPHAAILVAPPGAGKTTAVPLALLDDADLGQGVILVAEPRRVAARGAARRMAALRGEGVGGVVGYRTRFDRCIDPRRTRVQVVTDGVLAGQVQRDPTLPGVAAVVLDEFHERGLGSDLALALCLEAREARKRAGLPPLRLVAMSATLPAQTVTRLAALLGGARIARSSGRAFPVEIRHFSSERRLMRAARGMAPKGELASVVGQAVAQALRETDGDVLVFLPGEAEIRRATKSVFESLPSKRADSAQPRKHRGFGAAPQARAPVGPVEVLPLHGSLDAEEQDRAVRRTPGGERRVILATNVAEASITVEGVTAVVDGGLRRRARYSRETGVNTLETVAISQDSADQRAGRAGRLRDGLCLRLWAKGGKLTPSDLPEIMEVDLTSAVLSLVACGVPPPGIQSLPWLDAPPAESVQHAVDILHLLDALGDSGALTAHGRDLAALPLHPRLGHAALLAGARPRQDGRARGSLAELCALLEEDRDVLRTMSAGVAPERCADVRLRLRALHGDLEPPGRGEAEVAALPARVAQVLRVAQDIARVLPSGMGSLPVAENPGPLIALAYPERVAPQRAIHVMLRRGAVRLRSVLPCCCAA